MFGLGSRWQIYNSSRVSINQTVSYLYLILTKPVIRADFVNFYCENILRLYLTACFVKFQNDKSCKLIFAECRAMIKSYDDLNED